MDFDFFTQRRFNPAALCETLRERFPSTRAVVLEPDTCDLFIEDVRVSFFRYPYKQVEPVVQGDGRLQGLRMASPSDIAAMKLSAIGGRGSRKDFYDLYQIYHCVPGFNGERLISVAKEKFGPGTDLTYMLMGLAYFDDAEQEELPRTFVHADWEDIKRFFVLEQSRLFGMEEALARRAIERASEENA